MNPYTTLLHLLPKQVKYIGKITNILDNGTVHIAPVGAASIAVVKGGTDSYAINDYVMIVDGVITSKVDTPQTILEESVI